jgi:hypothetical protein
MVNKLQWKFDHVQNLMFDAYIYEEGNINKKKQLKELIHLPH